MSGAPAVAARHGGEYPSRVRASLHLLLLLAVAMLPLTSLAARAGTAADLTSSAVELEQAPFQRPAQKTPPAQEHRHCTIWAAEAEAAAALPDHPSRTRPALFASVATNDGVPGPRAPTPPPKF